MAIRRTQDEIVARIREVDESGDDPFGAEIGDLLSALDYTHAQPFLREGVVTSEEWDATYPLSEDALRTSAGEYMAFALGKARGHRGLSASRSINHFRAWVWLLEPELFAGFEAAPYENYGVPKLKAAVNALDLHDVWDNAVAEDLRHDSQALLNMAQGKPCREGCDEGCVS